MIMGASFFRAASKQALMPEEETQLTAGIAYPETLSRVERRVVSFIPKTKRYGTRSGLEYI